MMLNPAYIFQNKISLKLLYLQRKIKLEKYTLIGQMPLLPIDPAYPWPIFIWKISPLQRPVRFYFSRMGRIGWVGQDKQRLTKNLHSYVGSVGFLIDNSNNCFTKV